jgi:hypothetical protein
MLEIDLIEPLGSETLIHGHIQSGPPDPIVVRTPGAITSYETTGIGIPPNHIHLFDAKTTNRI